MLSSKQAAQPNPSCPASCRQDTTSPWSTDYGGNSKTLILTPVKRIRNTYKKEKKLFFEEQQKYLKEKQKTSMEPTPRDGSKKRFQRILFRNREAIEAKKSDFEHPTKKMKENERK